MSARRIEVVILGCGTSGGVPRVGGDWGACDPADPRNRRSRCSILVRLDRGEGPSTTVLVDTSPDLRQQLLCAAVDRLDAVFYTHDHADQAHGIDDLRPLAYRDPRGRLPVFMDATTRRALRTRFGYCFDVDPDNGYPAILDDAGELVAQQPVAIDGPGGTLTVVPLDQDHGGRPSLGFRFGCGDWMPVAYSNDCVALPERTLAGLTGLDLWIADAMRHRPHPTHAHLDQTLAWHRRLAPRRTVLTNLHVDMDYAEVQAMTPVEVEPAQDGLRIELHFP